MQAFSNKKCDGSHVHQRIHGSENGVTRSSLAQVYPDALCRCLAVATGRTITFRGDDDEESSDAD